MKLSDFLAQEWRPALGCTEPACIAWCASCAAAQAGGAVRAVQLVCDPRIYKNCYAVGIPHSGHRSGIRWALALGSLLPDASAGLECFRQITPALLEQAGALIEARALTLQVDEGLEGLHVDCRVIREGGIGRAVIEDFHTGLVRLERDGRERPLPPAREDAVAGAELRRELAAFSFADFLPMARSPSAADRQALRRGGELNLAIANHGLSLFPDSFTGLIGLDQMTRISRLVCAGVYARMCGEDFTVMSLAGSGNKGITTAVPLILWGRECGLAPERVDEALALACLVTAATTCRLGTLSAVCGCSNAAGIGLAAGLVLLQGGGLEGITRAVNNIVGNVTGMICDGAKIGCGLKTMTAVDSAFRAASLAMAGIGIPPSDGIVGAGIEESMAHLERIAGAGMRSMDAEILRIMQEKLR